MIYVEIAMAVIAIVVTALPAYGKLPRNRLVGVRTRATLASDRSWLRAHRAAILPMCLTGGVTIVGGIAAAAFGYVSEPVVLVALALVLLCGAVWSLVAATRAVGK